MHRFKVAYLFSGLLSVALLPAGGIAMQPLSDAELSATAGRDGIALNLDADISAQQIEWEMDAGTPQQASALLQDVTLSTGDGLDLTLDWGSDSSGTPFMLLTGSWSQLKARVGGISHSNEPGFSMGVLGLEATGGLSIKNEAGLFNASSDQASFSLNSAGDIFWRQLDEPGSPELSLPDYTLSIDIPEGTLGVDADGLFLAGDGTIDLSFDVAFAESTTQEFDKASRSRIVQTGWRGELRNSLTRISGGGVGYGSGTGPGGLTYFNTGGDFSYAPRSEGLNVLFETDFGESFNWLIGQVTDERARAEFTGWQRLGAQSGFGGSGERVALPGVPMADRDFRLPITLDAINAGQGPGNICFGGDLPVAGSLTGASCSSLGGDFKVLSPKDNAFAVIIRDGGLHAYNTVVNIVEDDGTGELGVTDSFKWGLVYTMGKIDSNIYLYPAGGDTNESDDVGFRSDLTLAVQSPGYWSAALQNFENVTSPGDPNVDPRARWATNSHFMIADTDIDGEGTVFGIGLANADILWQVRDFAVRLVNQATASAFLSGESNVELMPGVWLEATRAPGELAAQYQFRGLFGGGNFDDLEDLVRVTLIDINLETDRFAFVLGAPEAGENSLPFEALFGFNGNAYISIAEPSVPTAAYTIGNVEGALMWKDGEVKLESSNNTGDRPQLSISNNILLGETALTGRPLIGEVSLGNDTFGRLAIPSGQVYSSITLRPQ